MMKRTDSAMQDRALNALNAFQMEIPSLGFANTGTRFGKNEGTREQEGGEQGSKSGASPCRLTSLP